MESAFALALTAGIKGVAMVMDQEAQPLTSDPTRGRVIIGNHFFNFVLFCVGFLILCMVAIAFAFVSFPNYLLFFFFCCVFLFLRFAFLFLRLFASLLLHFSVFPHLPGEGC